MKRPSLRKLRVFALLMFPLLVPAAFADSVSGSAFVSMNGQLGVQITTPYGPISGGYTGTSGYLAFDPSTLQYSIGFYSDTGPQDYCHVLTDLCSAATVSATLQGILPNGLVFDPTGGIYVLGTTFMTNGVLTVEYWYDYDNAGGHHGLEIVPAYFQLSASGFYSPSAVGQSRLVAGAGVTATFPTPEPDSLILLASGLPALGANFRKLRIRKLCGVMGTRESRR